MGVDWRAGGAASRLKLGKIWLAIAEVIGPALRAGWGGGGGERLARCRAGKVVGRG